MNTHTNFKRPPARVIAVALFCALAAPVAVVGSDPSAPREQDFVLTAYYSPLPDQCCYVTGGYLSDMTLNGQGIAGADGTPVYPGMIAAPRTYAFGTRIDLPGLGTFTVHDRGGAIIESGDGTHRIDVWAGHGEEGLARALAFGVQRMRGTVYPLGSTQPAERFALTDLEAPLARLESFRVASTDLIDLKAVREDRTMSARILQEHLNAAGYFGRAPTGYFGAETQQSLQAFIDDYHLGEPADRLTERTAAYLVAAAKRADSELPLNGFVDRGSSKEAVRQAQRLMRFLGYYRGRTNGQYDKDLFAAILKFQQDRGLVGTDRDPGAGRIGPITRTKVTSAWNRALVASRAERLLTLRRVEIVLAERGQHLNRFLDEGDGGKQVVTLQRLLGDLGYFPYDSINGHFGPLTKNSVLQYQIDRGIVTSETSKGAGYVGVATLSALRREQRQAAYLLVRGQGWQAL